MNGYGGNILAATANYFNETPSPTSNIQFLSMIAVFLVLSPYLLLIRFVVLFLGSYTIEENLRSQTTPGALPDQALVQEGASLLKWLGISITLFISLIINLTFTALRTTTFFGHRLWKWCFLAFIFSFSHIFTNKAVMIDLNNSLKKMYGRFAGKSTSYYVTELVEPVISVISFGLILLGWLYFFRGQITPPNSSSDLIIGLIDGYGTLMVVFMFLRAVVRLLNTALLLKWKANALFSNDFAEGQILKAGFQIFFIYTVLRINPNTMTYLIQPWRKRQLFNRSSQGNYPYNNNQSVAGEFPPEDVTTQEISMIAQYAEAYTLVMPPIRTSANELNEMRDSCRAMLAPLDDSSVNYDQRIIQEKLNISQVVSELLFEELQRASNIPSLNQISYITFEKWIVYSYDECVELGKHLVALENMVVKTNRLLVLDMMIQAFLTWLYLIGGETTKVVVIIPSVFAVRHFFTTLLSPVCRSIFSAPTA